MIKYKKVMKQASCIICVQAYNKPRYKEVDMKRVCSIATVVCVTVLLVFSVVGCGNNGDSTNDLKYDESSMEAAIFIGRKGAYSLGADDNSLAAIIYSTVTQFDADNGGAGAHIANDCNREKFYKELRETIDDSSEYALTPGETGEVAFATSFQKVFGNLPDSNNDGTPDVASKDDDGDGVEDWEDDDDDNNGTMDWNEKDGNVGGKGNEYNESDPGQGNGATGKGRGPSIGDRGEDHYETPGENDSKNPVNGSDTSHLDDGK